MNEIIERNKERYRKTVNKQDKSKIVESIARSTGMHRKAIIRALNRTSDVVRINKENIAAKPRKRLGRPPIYIGEVDAALEEIWQTAGCICAELLVDFRAELIRILKRDGMWNHTIETTDNLLRMSLSTLKRKIAKLNRKHGLLRGISTTNSSGSIKQLVPVFIGNYRHMGLGYGQIDTVVHSGPKLIGVMAYSVLYIDMETCWTVVTAQYGKTPEATLLSIQKIAQRLPWLIRGLHPDNGSEFLNSLVLNYCHRKSIKLTRSRPYKKNDNCFVEERNQRVIRKYAGFNRYDHPKTVVVLNELYEAVCLYVNFFQPTFKVARKEIVENNNGIQTTRRTKKIYGKALTPYQRVMDSSQVPMETKIKLTKQYESLNPVILRARISALQSKLNKLQKQLGYHYELDGLR